MCSWCSFDSSFDSSFIPFLSRSLKLDDGTKWRQKKNRGMFLWGQGWQKRDSNGKKGGGGGDVSRCVLAEVRKWSAKGLSKEARRQKGKKAKRQKGKNAGLGGKSISLTFIVSAIAYASVSNPMLSFFSFCPKKKREEKRKVGRRLEEDSKKIRRRFEEDSKKIRSQLISRGKMREGRLYIYTDAQLVAHISDFFWSVL